MRETVRTLALLEVLDTLEQSMTSEEFNKRAPIGTTVWLERHGGRVVETRVSSPAGDWEGIPMVRVEGFLEDVRVEDVHLDKSVFEEPTAVPGLGRVMLS